MHGLIYTGLTATLKYLNDTFHLPVDISGSTLREGAAMCSVVQNYKVEHY